MPPSSLRRLEEALGELAGAEVELERPSDPEHGEYATNVALRLAGPRKQAPRELGQELAAEAAALAEVDRAEVAGPGFINLWLTREWYAAALEEVLAAGAAYGAGSAERAQRVQVEMVSANPTGPIPVSAGRNAGYGDSVARLLELAGNEVEREYYYNDAGLQVERFRASVEARRRGEEPPAEGYQGEYVKALAELEGDPVPPMLAQIEATLERFRVHFDTWALQSELEQRLPELLPRLNTYDKDGAVWLRSSAYGDEDDRVIVRSPERGGTPTYRAADIVYLVDKLERGFDRAIYILGADHHGTRKWYAAIARMLGYDPERVEVLLYQFVHLVTTMRTLDTTTMEELETRAMAKISKRSGDLVTLDELMDEIGVDAARWYLVSRGPDQTIEIDVDLAKEKTAKNPVYYVQYVHARIAGIFRNAGAALVDASPPPEIAGEEKSLIRRLLELPRVAAEATERRGPHAIPNYAIRVADDFHRFYTEHRVLESDAQAFRLGLCRATQTVVARCLDLIAVEAPERM